MQLSKYTIFDSKLEAYHQDYSLENDAIALRQFADMANEDTHIAKNPEDYSLWKIGEYENTTGELIPQEPVCIAKAHEHVIIKLKSNSESGKINV